MKTRAPALITSRMKVLPANPGTGLPDARAITMILTSTPDMAADFRASTMLASGMKWRLQMDVLLRRHDHKEVELADTCPLRVRRRRQREELRA